MPLEVQCDKCSRKFRASEKLAGKKVKCPNCQTAILVPGAAAGPSAPKTEEGKPGAAAKGSSPTKTPPLPKTAGAAKTAKKTPVARPLGSEEPAEWHMMTSEGEEFGPVTRSELDSWVTEGRLDGTCQVLKDGWDQWKWADDLYPELAEAKDESAAEPGPFAGIGDATAPAVHVVSEAGPGIVATAAGGEAAVTPRVRMALSETRPWVMFLAILGLIGNGLGALGGLVFFFLFGLLAGGPGIGMGLMMLVSPALGLVAAYFLLTYGLRIGNFLRSGAGREFEEAMIAQKSFWKLAGIVTLVILVLYVVILIMVMLLGGLAAFTLHQAIPKG